MPKPPPGEWTAADATVRIRASAMRRDLNLSLTVHAREQMNERDLVIGDLLYLLRQGYVYDRPEEATRKGFFKYAVEGTSPNSGGRTLKTIVIPDGETELKIVTIMWRDKS